MGKTTILTERDTCPFCGHFLDMASAGPENPDAVPEPGDITVCIRCAGILVFGEGLKLRKPDNEELSDALAQKQVIDVVKLITELNTGRTSS